MGKSITFEYAEKTYTLEYNRKAVTAMEAQGFNINDVGDKPMTMIPLLFYGAFRMHHPMVKDSLAYEIYTSCGDKEGLINALVEMYGDTLMTLMTDPGESKNVSWAKNW